MERREIGAALIGNPNVGKSLLFNAITGSEQAVGNWCGKTTEPCIAVVSFEDSRIRFADLPGVYGLGQLSREEAMISRYLKQHPEDILVIVVDAFFLERNLYLAVEALDHGYRIIIAVTKTDMAEKRGLHIDCEAIAAQLKVPVIPVVAAGHINIEQLYTAIVDMSETAHDVSMNINYSQQVEQAIAAIQAKQMVNRLMAMRQLEQTDENLYTDIVNTRYTLASRAAQAGMVRPVVQEKNWLDRLDYWLLHKVFGIPIMLVVFTLLFYLTFSFSRPASDWIGERVDELSLYAHQALPMVGMPEAAVNLTADGLINGVGAALGFLPQIAVFFFVYTFIQDSGYIVRVAFLVDRLMSIIGLNGKTFLPVVVGYTCNVNGILASRMLTSRYDRLVVLLISSFAPCSARLGVMVFLVAAFFDSAAGVAVMLSLLAISVALMAAVAFGVKLFVRQDETSFVLEMPVYQVPDVRHLLRTTLKRTIHFTKRIRNVIILSSIVTWYLSSYPLGPFENSYMAKLGLALEPFGHFFGLDWQLIVALIMGIAAKETTLTALSIIFHASAESGSLAEILKSHIDPVAAFSFVVIYMVYTPCAATVIAIYQETRSWLVPMAAVLCNAGFALLLAFVIFHMGRLLFA